MIAKHMTNKHENYLTPATWPALLFKRFSPQGEAFAVSRPCHFPDIDNCSSLERSITAATLHSTEFAVFSMVYG
jgi:hypothetical protein